MVELILYSRSYCHLCEDLLNALNARFATTHAYRVEVIDVDADEALVAKYDELVPVLVVKTAAGEVELCHYHLDEAAVKACLDANGGFRPRS